MLQRIFSAIVAALVAGLLVGAGAVRGQEFESAFDVATEVSMDLGAISILRMQSCDRMPKIQDISVNK